LPPVPSLPVVPMPPVLFVAVLYAAPDHVPGIRKPQGMKARADPASIEWRPRPCRNPGTSNGPFPAKCGNDRFRRTRGKRPRIRRRPLSLASLRCRRRRLSSQEGSLTDCLIKSVDPRTDILTTLSKSVH